MKSLLIIGAGGHGKVVAEVAEACGYERIAFLDDNSSEAVGKIGELNRFSADYEDAFVGIGNNELRGKLLAEAECAGYGIPVLVHNTAYVSKTAKIGKGTVVEPNAVVNAYSEIGEGCIISVGSVVDHNTVISRCCHINAGAIVKAGAALEPYTKLESGEVVMGYPNAVVKNKGRE